MSNALKKQLSRAGRTVLFIIALAAVLVSLNSCLMLIQEDNLCPRYFRYPKDTFDLVFLGASQVLYGIYPLELYGEYGMASYSLSTGNQSLEASYYLAREAIRRDHPRLIVLDCSRACQDEEEMKPQYVHYLTDTMPCLSANRFDMVRNLVPEGEDIMPLLFPLLAYHSRWQELTFEDALPQAKEMVYGAKVTSRIEPGGPFDAPAATDHAMTETSRKYIQKTIDLCRETGTELLMITMPVLAKNRYFGQKGYNLRVGAAREAAQLAGENGILFADFFRDREEFGFDLSMDLSDGEHFNRWGAAKFTRGLGKYIREHYDIPDRRGEGAVYGTIRKDFGQYPRTRMKDSLRQALDLRDYAAVLQSDLVKEPVEDVLVLAALNGMVDREILSEEEAGLLREAGIRQDLHSWKGHGWLAVIEDGLAVYESEPGESADFADSFCGTAGKIRYEVTSGSAEEETGRVSSGASIRVNGLEYTDGEPGLHFAVFEKSTGKLLDSCRLDIFTSDLKANHDNH